MTQHDATREVRCTLTAEQEAERSAAVESLLVSHYAGYQERENGIDIRFDGTDESLQAVARFTSNELQCCSFGDYEITVSPPYEETVLTISGPEGTQQLFREGLVEPLEEQSAQVSQYG